MKKLTIAIDGYSSTGKSTIAKDIAQKLGYSYIDTGAMYRAVTYYGMQKGLVGPEGIQTKALINELKNVHLDFRFNTETLQSEIHLNGVNIENEIRQMDVSAFVSKVSQVSDVRTFLVYQQQQMGANKGVVLDGRDIGTVVFPKAELKIFMTASPEVRAQRRYDELIGKGQKIRFEEVLENLKQRDYDDTHREESPLIQAKDAKILDNSYINRDEQLQLVMTWVHELL